MDQLLKRKLKLLVQSKEWEAIYPFQAYIVEQWNKMPLVADTEYETIKNAISRQAKVDGLSEFIENIERIALDVN